MRFNDIIIVIAERQRLWRRRIFSAADECCGRVEGRSEAVAVASEVIHDEVFINVAAVAEDAIAGAVATRLNVCDHKHA